MAHEELASEASSHGVWGPQQLHTDVLTHPSLYKFNVLAYFLLVCLEPHLSVMLCQRRDLIVCVLPCL